MFVSRGGVNRPECLIQPDKYKCRRLAFVLETIIEKEIHWINTIYIDEIGRAIDQDDVEAVKFPLMSSKLQRSITISCSQSCVLRNDFGFSSAKFNKQLTIQMENMTLLLSRVAVRDVQVNFVNVHFLNTWVFLWETLPGTPREMTLSFSGVKFEKGAEGRYDDEGSGIFINRTLVASISIRDSSLINADTFINVAHLRFESSNTSYLRSQVRLRTETFCSARFHQVQMINLTEEVFKENSWNIDVQKLSNSVLHVSADKIHLEVVDSVIANNVGGLTATNGNPDTEKSWLQIQIRNSVFKNNSKMGYGGALDIQFFAPEIGWYSHNNVEIKDTIFVRNKVVRKGSTHSVGGAVSVQTHFPLDEARCHKVFFSIEDSSFIDNQAEDGGGALFMSDKCVDTAASNCTFEITDQSFDSPRGVFVLSESDISVEQSTMERLVKYTSPSLVELQML